MTKIKITNKSSGMTGCNCNNFSFPLCFPFGWKCSLIKSAKRCSEQLLKATKRLTRQQITSKRSNEQLVKATKKVSQQQIKAKQENE